MKSASALSMARVVRALQCPKKGLRGAWRDEAALRQELGLMLLLAPLTIWLPLPRLDTALLLSLMGLVLLVELPNLGLEAVVDIASPECNAPAAKAKDCGSAAVFVAAVMLGGTWLALAGPALWSRLLH